MRINRDYFDNPVVPDYVLCKANKERIGVLRCTEKKLNLKFNSLNGIIFTTYLFIDGEKNIYYDSIDVMKYVLVPEFGFFAITSVEIESEGSEFEYKSVTAKSCECLLAEKYLEDFVINAGTVESIDGVRFYDLRNKDKSLLHLVLDKCPSWKIGHIDSALLTMERSFEVTRQDIYTFLIKDTSEAFGCIFLFDSLTDTINVYQEENVGKNTNIHISYNNLAKSTKLSCSTDNIKTCLSLKGSDDLTIREINMGYDKIYNFEYYNSTDYMSKALYNAYNKWITLRKSKLPEYTAFLSQYQDYYKQINYLTHKKMPSVTGSTDWTEYGLQPLKEQLEAYEQRQSVAMKAGHGDPSSPFYESQYLPVYNTIQSIQAQIAVIESQLSSLKAGQDSIQSQMAQIIDAVSIENNFTEAERKELNSFIREDELSSDNYIVTDSMTDDERFEMLNDLLKYGEKELAKASVPQLTFDVDMVNLFALPDFKPFHMDFDPGNYVWVTLRDDFSVKARLLSVHMDFLDNTDFSVTFGNVVKRNGSKYHFITEALRKAESAATSVSFNSSHWSRAAKDTSIINQILNDGLIASGKYLKNGDDSEMLIDSRGIFVNTTTGPYANKDSIFIGGGRVLFTDDNWKTVSMSVGRADVTIKGVTESRFGTFADFMIAGYAAASTLEGNMIIGGTLVSTNYDPRKTGSSINLNDGTFEFNANGESKLVLESDGTLTVKGTIKADKGYIGGKDGFSIEDGKLYIGKTSISSSSDGVYIGTDGIALGRNNVFSVDVQGNMVASAGTIGGAVISGNSIHSSNNKWWINADGSASFNNVTISGNSTFGSSVNNPFSGTTIPHIESLATNYIKTNYLDSMIANINTLYAKDAQLENLIATKASIADLNATNAEIENIKANYITAAKVETDYMNVRSWTQAGKIKADRIDVDQLFGEEISGRVIHVNTLEADIRVSAAGLVNAPEINCNKLNGKTVGWENVTIGGKSYTILTG